MEKCFICNDLQTSTAQDASRGGADDIMRIVCQLLRIRSDDILNDASSRTSLPFCSLCVTGVKDLISLRATLVQLETEMMGRIRELQLKIVSTIGENERDILQLEQNQQDSQSIFRKQTLEEYEANELLRLKILELRRGTSSSRESDPLGGDYIIEIEPSFVQLQFGGTSICRTLRPPTTKRSLRPRSKHSRPGHLSPPSILKTEGDRGENISVDVRVEEEETSDWIENQNGPLTRLRLSTALPKVKEEPNEFTDRDAFHVETMMKSDGEDDEFYTFRGNRNVGGTDAADTDFQIDQEDDNEGTEGEEESSSDFETFIQRKRSSRSKAQALRRRGQKVGNGKQSKSPGRRQWPIEVFNEIQTNVDGRLFYEGVEIERRAGNSHCGAFILKCGSCPKEIDKRTSVSHQRSPYRMMQVHIKAEHLEAYKCPECGKVLRDFRILKQHMEKRHPPDGKRATLAPRVFGSSKMPPEVVTNEDGGVEFQGVEIRRIDCEGGDYDVVCGVCGKLFNKKTSQRCKQCPYRQMLNHIKGVHLRSFCCQLCDKTFRNSKTFKMHLNKHAKPPEDSQCEICGRPISDDGYKKKHMWTHKNEEEREAALKSGQKGPQTYGDLMLKRKAAGPAFQCYECGKTFHFAANLRRHEHVHKKEIREHQCAQCGKSYCTAESLKSHIKYIHETERVHKKYRCSFCPKWFVTKSPWTKHERTHSKAIPYNCPTCDKGFALKQSFGAHIRNKKCNTGFPQQTSAPQRKRRKKEQMAEANSIRGAPPTQPSQNQDNNATATTTALNLQQLPFNMGIPLPAHQNNIPTSSAGGSFSFPVTYLRSLEPNYIQQPHYDAYV